MLPEWAQRWDSVPTSQYWLRGFPEDGRQGYHCQKQDQRDGEEWQEENIILGIVFGKQHQASLASVRAFLQKPEYGSPVDAWTTSSIPYATTKLSGATFELPDAEASATGSST
jgi:hypothetical protein